MSGSHFIVQTIKVLLIDATAVTLGECQGTVIQYIFPTHVFFVPNIEGLAKMVLMWEAKVVVAADTAAAAHAAVADTAADAAETKWKQKVTPDQGDLMNK